MESKPKIRQVRKVRSATHARQKSQEQQSKTLSPEALIRHNGDLVESLLCSTAWTEIAFPLLREMIAGVSGRYTNGRFHHGTLTREFEKAQSNFLSGYQKALMDFSNNLQDFIDTKNKQAEKRKNEELEKKAPVYNPFMEDVELED